MSSPDVTPALHPHLEWALMQDARFSTSRRWRRSSYRLPAVTSAPIRHSDDHEANLNPSAAQDATIVVQRQLDAYNARNVDDFLACFSTDARIENGEGRALASGHAALRALYGPLFTHNPQLCASVRARHRFDDYVVDEEYVTGINWPVARAMVAATAVYHVRADVIVYLRLFL